MKILLLTLILLTSCSQILRKKEIEPTPQEKVLNKEKSNTSQNQKKSKDTLDNTTKLPENRQFTDSIKVAIDWEKNEIKVFWENAKSVSFFNKKNELIKEITETSNFATLKKEDDSLVSIKTNGLTSKQEGSITIVANGGFLKFNNSKYRGIFTVKHIANKGLFLINNLQIEEYLKGVVPNEMGPKTQEIYQQALQAQSIVARSYTYAKMGKHKQFGFDLKASVADQVYKGMSSEFAQCSKAVDATKGIIMEYNNQPVVAYYHSTCGGYTSSFEDCWFGITKIDYLKSRNDFAEDESKYCKKSFKANWSVKYPKSELANYLTNQYKIKNVKSIKITKFSESKRVHTLEIKSSDKVHTFNGDKVRWVFKKGSTILPSSKFEIKEDKNNYYFIGQGYGHGVGMCQFGAMGRSENGQNAKEILNAYYTNIEFVNVYNTTENKLPNANTNIMLIPDNSEIDFFDEVFEKETGLEF